jgi:hypothetical protein
MRKISLVLVFISFLSCKKDETKSVASDLQTEINQKDTLETKPKSAEKRILSTDWQDSLIVDYVKNSKKDLIKMHFKNNDKLEWILDRTQKNDSTQFYIYNIGVDVAEEDGSEPRFSSCGWVYLDSVKRKLYEYDLPNDTIVEWKK